MTTNKQKLEWYYRNKEHVREYQKSDYFKDVLKRYAQSALGKANQSRKDKKRWNTKKVMARKIVQAAVKHGMLTRGTCHCGKVGEGHHEDYDKPLEVIWLCREHHREVHNEQVSRVKYPAGYVG